MGDTDMDDVYGRGPLQPQPSAFSEPNPMITIPESQWREQQQRLLSLEASLRTQQETISQLSALAPTPSVTPGPIVPERTSYVNYAPVPRSAKIAPPDSFSGDRHKVYLYLSKCRHNFLSQPELFTTEAKKVLFASGYLDGAAYNWFQPLLDLYALAVAEDRLSDIPIQFTSFAEYTKALEDTFGDPDLVRSKERELRNLVQTTSVATYTSDFNRIKGFVKWNDDALTSQYYKGLKPGVKDGMVYENPTPTTLNALIAASFRLDSRIYDHILERKLEHPPGPRTSKPITEATLAPRAYPPATQPYPRPTTAARTPTTPIATAVDGTTPMELDFTQLYRSRPRGALVDSERQRRRDNNLCLYCGSPNHHVNTCPLAPPRPPPHPQ